MVEQEGKRNGAYGVNRGNVFGMGIPNASTLSVGDAPIE